MRKLYQFTLYAAAATIVAIMAGYAVLASDWSSYSGVAIQCDNTPSPSDCVCPEDEVKRYKDGFYNCEKLFDPDLPHEEQKPPFEMKAPADPILREDGAFCAEHPDHPDCIVDGPPGCADKDQCE